MKKIGLIILVLGFVIGAFAYSEEIDLASISDNDLLALHDRIDYELSERGLSPRLDSGDYFVGKDIGAGKYRVQCYGEDDSYYWKIKIFKNANAKVGYEKACNEYSAALRLAEDKKENGEEYVYPTAVVESNYFRVYSIWPNDDETFSIEDGEVMNVMLSDTEMDTYLSISKSEGLFMN